jgi:catechol 2,3-dioxygenase-like lactoylglutathione lyase family enzyme
MVDDRQSCFPPFRLFPVRGRIIRESRCCSKRENAGVTPSQRPPMWVHGGTSGHQARVLAFGCRLPSEEWQLCREDVMKSAIAGLCLMMTLGTAAASAQPFTPNAMGVTMGHWHLNSRDVEANKKIFAAMGGTAVKAGDFEIVRFPGVVVMLHLRPGAATATGGTVGSVVNHVGFTVPNVQEAMAKWKAAGVPVEPGRNGRLNQAYVTTPDGLRVEILENKAQKFPIQHEHVHFFVAQSAIPEMQAWYVKVFGAKPSTRSNGSPIADLPGTQFRFNKVETAQAPTMGRILDHIGFDVTDLPGFIKKLEAAGITLDRPYTKNARGGALAFIHDPWGTSIELNERPNAVYIN